MRFDLVSGYPTKGKIQGTLRMGGAPIIGYCTVKQIIVAGYEDKCGTPENRKARSVIIISSNPRQPSIQTSQTFATQNG